MAATTFGPYDPECRVVVICGGGPAGLLAACALSKRGFKVHVLEKREDPAKARPGRSWRIVLQERAQKALELADFDVASSEIAMKMRGAMLHSARGKRELLYNVDVPPYGVDRSDLAALLLQKAQRHRDCELHFNAGFEEFGDAGNTLTFSGGPGGCLGPWAFLIAADGEHSSIRQNLEAKFGFISHQVLSDKDYIQISGASSVLQKMGLDRRYVNVFNTNGDAQLIFTTRSGDVDGGVLVLNQEGDASFKSLRAKTPQGLKKFLQDAFTKEGEAILEAAYDGKFKDYLEAADVFPGNSATHCVQFDALDGRVLIIGDAAHSMSASIGQGCNTALEDVTVLNSLLQNGLTFAEVAKKFSQQRRDDIDAIAYMSANAFPQTKVAFAAWVTQSILIMKLNNLMPSLFPQPMRNLISTDVPYKVVLQRKRFEERFFKAFASAIFLYPSLFVFFQRLPLGVSQIIAVLPCIAFMYASSALIGSWPDSKLFTKVFVKDVGPTSAAEPLLGA